MAKMKKVLNLAMMGLMVTIMFGLTIQTGFTIGSNATVEAINGELVTEEVLLQKDKVINKIAKYEEGLNPYFATSKSTLLSNFRVDEIEWLEENGYTILVTGQRDNENLPQPVKVIGKKIIVSIYSNDAEVIETVKGIL